MDSSSLLSISTPHFEAIFMLGLEDLADTVENVDAEVRLTDGTRWSVTFLTLGEISRIMDRWGKTGENLNGWYFQCADLVIVKEAGVHAMVKALRGIIDAGGPDGVLVRLD